jgi:hypothetical protein
LVITFSDVQARLAESLIKAGIPVLALNHFTVAGVADAIRLVGRVLGREETGETLASWCGKPVNIDSIRSRDGFSSIDAVRDGQIHELAPASGRNGEWAKRRSGEALVTREEDFRAWPILTLRSMARTHLFTRESAVGRPACATIPPANHGLASEARSTAFAPLAHSPLRRFAAAPLCR